MLAKIALIGALVLATTPLIDSTPVSAQAVTETQPFNINECRDYSDYFYAVLCVKGNGVTHITARPNGDTQYVTNQNVCHSVRYTDYPQYNYESCQKSYFTYIIKNGEPQVYRNMYQAQGTLNGQTCTYRVQYLYANGQPRVEKVDFSCV